MFNLRKAYEGRKVERVNAELESSLKRLQVLEGAYANLSAVESELGRDVVLALCDLGLARYVNETDESGFGTYVRVERTMDGRCYFSERWRDRAERYGTVVAGGLIGGFFTIAGALLGFWLATLGT